MHYSNVSISKYRTIALLAGAAIGLTAATCVQAQEQENCRTFHPAPGIAQAVGVAQGTQDAGGFTECRTTYPCGSNARKVKVFGFGLATASDAVLAVENSGTAADGSELVLASCEAVESSSGQRKRLRSRACLAESELIGESSFLEEAECVAVVVAPANATIVGSATCFCEE